MNNRTSPGYLNKEIDMRVTVTVEGKQGAGKSTLIRILEAALTQNALTFATIHNDHQSIPQVDVVIIEKQSEE